MRVLVQRVSEARVLTEGVPHSAIGSGLLLLVGVAPSDGEDAIQWLCRKIAALRIFADEQGLMNRSLQEMGGDALAVSQFTLYASTKKGNRPSFTAAAPPEIAEPLFRRFVLALEAQLGKPVPTGIFGAHMHVQLCNDGPVTIWLDSEARD